MVRLLRRAGVTDQRGELLRLALVLYDERARAPDSARDDLTHRVEKLLDAVITISVSDELLDAAGALPESGLRSLDAIHLATALHLGNGLSDFVTYDRRLLAAARQAGLSTAAPH